MPNIKLCTFGLKLVRTGLSFRILLYKNLIEPGFWPGLRKKEGYIFDPYVIFLPTRNIVNKVTINIYILDISCTVLDYRPLMRV